MYTLDNVREKLKAALETPRPKLKNYDTYDLINTTNGSISKDLTVDAVESYMSSNKTPYKLPASSDSPTRSGDYIIVKMNNNSQSYRDAVDEYHEKIKEKKDDYHYEVYLDNNLASEICLTAKEQEIILQQALSQSGNYGSGFENFEHAYADLYDFYQAMLRNR